MTKQEIFILLTEYLVKDFEVPKNDITLKARLYEDLDLDSIDAVDLVVKLQALTKDKILAASFKEVRTIEDVVDKVYELVPK